MTNYPQLLHPPLRETIIYLQFANELASETMTRLKEQTLEDYVAPRPIRAGQFRLQVGPEATQTTLTKDELDGWRYDSKDGSRVLLLRRGSATFSVLRGYTSWDDFKASASKLWVRIYAVVGNVMIARLAVRYINVVQVPHGADFDDYLTAGPRIPPQAPQLLSGFIQRVEIPFGEANATATITQALEPPGQTSIPVVLDIDVQSPIQLEGHSAEIWTRLDKLRDIKNLLFFSSLTKRALELFQ